MSLRLRGGRNGRRGGNATSSNTAHESNYKNLEKGNNDDDEGTLFTLDDDADRLLDSVLEANTADNGPNNNMRVTGKATANTSASHSQQQQQQQQQPQSQSETLDDLLFSNDDRSDAESTALSSFVVPMVTSSQIRANAPRVTGTGAGPHNTTASAIRSSSVLPLTLSSVSETRQNSIHPSQSPQEQSNDDEYTLGTMDDNRPIDQLFIYHANEDINPSNPSNRSSSQQNNTNTGSMPHLQQHHHHTQPMHTTGHRQRRNKDRQQKRSSSKSVISALGDGSFGLNENTASGILESLGLGSGTLSAVQEPPPKHSNADGNKSVDSNSKSQKYKNKRNDHYIHRSNLLPRSSSQPRSAPSPFNSAFKLNMRAFTLLLGLFILGFSFFQWTMAVKHNSREWKRMHSHNFLRNQKGYTVQTTYESEEGVDRPMKGAVSALLEGKVIPPSELQLLHVKGKVPIAGDRPEQIIVEESNSAVFAIDEEANAEEHEHEQDKEHEQPLDEEPAGDPLVLPDKEEAPVVMDVALSIEEGLSGVYKTDSNHKDIPFLWVIPRSGSTIVTNIASQCVGLTVASAVGATVGAKGTVRQKLEVVEVEEHSYINADTTTVEGIEEAKRLNLASSALVQLVVSPRIQEASTIFSSTNHGRAFTMIRHPVERAISMFFYLKKAKVPAVAKLDVEEYAKSSYVENNWMVRMLSGSMEGPIGEAELVVAKKVLKTKIIVGLLEQKDASMARYEYYFGWKYTSNPARQSACKSRILSGNFHTNESSKIKVKKDSQAWNLLMWQNKLDMKLYKYAKSLFLQQATELFSDMPYVD